MSTQHPVELAELVTHAREGDPAAQDALISAHLPLVYNIVGRALNGSVDVDDVVQDTMLRALDGLAGLREPGSFRSWLVAIAMNRVRRHWQDRQAAPGGVEEADRAPDPGADFVDLTVLRLQLSGQRQETARATRWLEPDDRGLLSLWWLECAGELTRAEVAQALALSPQHTAVRVQRMKAQLEAARVVVRALDARPRCRQLAELLVGWDGRPSALWRKRIARHARECVRCAGLWSGLVPAEGLLAGLGLVPVPMTLAPHPPTGHDGTPTGSASEGVDGTAATDDGAAATDNVTAAADDVTASYGGHATGGRAAARRRRGRGTARDAARRKRRIRRRATAAAVVAACLAGGGAWYFGHEPDGGSDGSETLAGAPTAPVTGLPTPVGSPSHSPSPSASPTKSPSASKSPGASSSSGAFTSPSPAKSSPELTKRPQPLPSRTTAGASSAQSAPAGAVAQVIALVNQERAKAGCGPVSGDSQLDAAARAHSEDMAARDFFEHTNPDGEGPGDRITSAGYRWSSYGENIARGQQTPESVMNSWMNSPPHRANILNCAFKDLGVGVLQGSGGPWWTQDFGTK
ncbi:sigma-70 family RNA polymerase sigma factor [Streptomyces sp. NPDC088923]|uniref:sigma-70 family RNA polymerase sigma factor n=1 Tax=Streptomyces sp. NPDC088923 TaxID=3365913 RepID=UPI003817D5FE